MGKINKNVFMFALLSLGIIASAMLFLPALIYSDTDSVFTGFQTVFGTEFASLGIFGSGQLEPIFLGMLAFIIPVIAGLLSIVFSKNGFISMILFLVATILLFLLPTLANPTITILGDTSPIDVTWTMGAGLIVAICASASGAVVSLLQAVEQRK